jgi:hypothetical protein
MTKNEDKTSRERAGVNSEDLDYFLPIGQLLVNPAVELAGKELRWRDGVETVEVSAPKDLLDQFIKLKDAEGESIRSFARKWGRLDLCIHDMPCTHKWVPVFHAGRPGVTSHWCVRLQKEPTELWRAWARKLDAVLNVTAHINAGRHGDINQWKLLFEDTGWPFEDEYVGSEEGEKDLTKLYNGYWLSKEFSAERMWLSDIINNYLDIGGVRPRLRLFGYEYEAIMPHVSLSGFFQSSLFAVLALQLMVVVSGTKTAAICTACGTTYFPQRRPKTGQANFCNDSNCQRVARREATRRWRNKPEVQKKLARLKREQSRQKLKGAQSGKAGTK